MSDKKKHGHFLLKLLIGAGLIVLCLILMLLFKNFPDFFFPWYRNFSKGFIKILASLHSLFPFAVWDYLLTGVILGTLLFLVFVIVKKRSFINFLSSVFLMASVIAAEVIIGWMLNHYGPALSEEIGLETGKYTKEELYNATEYYFDKAAEYASFQERDEEGHLISQDFNELAEIAGKSYTELAKTYDIFTGSNAPVKKLSLFGEILLYSGFTGEFMPVTGEATVPANETTVCLPFTMCHEAAHRLGIADEEDANFAAFLACEASTDERFTYSGYYEAFVYCYNKLYKADYDLLIKLLQEKETDTSHALVLLDTEDQRRDYKEYESSVQESAEKVNDTYLKTFSETEGTKSYGRVVDDLLAWYLETLK